MIKSLYFFIYLFIFIDSLFFFFIDSFFIQFST